MLMTRMFSETPGTPGPQAADAADDQVDLHAGGRGFVEGLDDPRVHQRVHLGDDPRRAAGLGVCSASRSMSVVEPAGQLDRGHDQLVPGPSLGITGQQVEQGAGVFAELGAAGEEAQVGVEPGGGRVVIARAQVDVAADAVVLAADDERGLAVGLQSDDPVDDVNAGLLEHPGLVDVVFLVEPGLELDQGGDLLAVLGGAGQGADDRVGVGGAVEGHLDRQDLGVLGRLLDELDDGAERFVRVVHQDDPASRMAVKMLLRVTRQAGI